MTCWQFLCELGCRVFYPRNPHIVQTNRTTRRRTASLAYMARPPIRRGNNSNNNNGEDGRRSKSSSSSRLRRKDDEIICGWGKIAYSSSIVFSPSQRRQVEPGTINPMPRCLRTCHSWMFHIQTVCRPPPPSDTSNQFIEHTNRTVIRWVSWSVGWTGWVDGWMNVQDKD